MVAVENRTVEQRLARILYAMWLKEEDFDVAKLNVVKQRHTRTKTYYWRMRKPEEQFVTA